MILMLVGNAGIVTGMASLMLTFVHDSDRGWFIFALKIALLVSSLIILWMIASSAWVDRHLSVLIERGLKRYTRLNVRDYESLMQLAGDYRLVELAIGDKDWIAGKTLAEADLYSEGLLVLAVNHATSGFVGVPHGDTRIHSNDTLVLYGHLDAIEALDTRRRSHLADQSHREATLKHEQRKRENPD